MSCLNNRKTSTLRGGGCGVSIESQNTQKNSMSDIQDIEIFITRFDFYVETICLKAAVAANQQEAQEIMIAIQWFVFQEENIYQLSKNAQKVLKTYNLILEGIRRLLKSCLIYIRTDQFKCLYILQITASLSKVIFSFHLINNKRFMIYDLQQEFLDLSDELKQQIEIEKNDMIQIQLEFYLFLTKTSFEMAPNNSNERNEILKGCLCGIIGSIAEMKPTAELIESLFQGACLFYEMLYKVYALKKKRIQYEVYFQIDMLQWEIISYFKNEKQKHLDQVLEKIQAMHEKLVKNSNNWKNHFLWIQMMGKILVYNPLLTEQKLRILASSYNIEANSRQIWKEYQNKGLIIQMNHSNDQAVIQLNQFQNKQLVQLDRIILQDIFKEWQQFIILKEFLLNEHSQNIHFTFRSYLQNKFKLSAIEPQENDYILAVGRIKKFFDIIISNKLIFLIRENYEKLQIVNETYKNLMEKSTMFKERIKQTMQNQKINIMILNLQEYIQNTQNIIKIIKLHSRKQNYQTSQLELQIELKNCQQLKYLMKVLEQICEQLIQGFQQRSNEIDETVEIQQELTKLQLKSSWLDNLRKKLLALLAASLDQKNYFKTASSLIQLITNSWKELEKYQNIEISSLQNNNNMIEFIENQLNYLYIDFKDMNKELNNDKNESMLILKQIIQFNYQFESFQNIEHLKDIELIKHIEKLRFKHLKLHLKLDNIKKSFLNILAQANKQEIQQLQQFVNLDGFLLSVVRDYPIKIICSNSAIDKLIIAELKSAQFTQQDYQNKLSNQKGLIQYLKFHLSLEEQRISSEKSDLGLIEKELGELFIEESTSQMRTEKIIESIYIEELLNYVSDKHFNLSELQKEKAKFENCLSELRKIKGSSQYQNRDQAEIDYCNQLTVQIEKVIKTLGTFGSLDKKIFYILIKQELMNLLKTIQEKDQKNIINQNNQNEEILQTDKSSVLQNSNEINFFSKENPNTYLSFMIKVVKLQLLKIKEEKEFLHSLLQEMTSFSDNLDLIQSYEVEIQNECFQIFQCRYQQVITNFESFAITHLNLQQKEDENFVHYFERISSNLSKGSNNKEITQTQRSISDFFNSIQAYFQQKLGLAIYFTNTSINQEFLMQQIIKLYLLNNQEEDYDDNSYQELGLIDTFNQKFQDFNNNKEWKIKQGLVFTIIYISSNCFTDTIISFCQKTLIYLWVKEKDQRVRNLLKNETIIKMQMQILKKDWQTQHDRIAGEMQLMLKKIEQLQEQICHEANLSKRDLQLKVMDETTQQLDEYIENVNEMGQQLTLITDFVNHIRKNLLRVEGKINEMKEQLNSVGYDIKYLRGKSVEQLLEIRKWKVLKEAAYINVKSIYVPLKTQEKEKKEQSNLMNLEQFDDRVGEVNEFLLEEEKTVMLIHGIAGSGKSTTAKKIEEFIWIQHENNRKIRNQVLIPIYISLPSLKNPVFQAVEETLLQDDYGFDNLQLKECKQKLEKKEFRFLLIMDSYDEMKLENIQKNLYLNNKVKQNWSDPLVIFTTRSEIFTSINYMDWFTPEQKNKFKEVQLLKFDKEQIKEYLKKFTILSIKMLIFEIYEWQMQVKKRSIDINQFELCWGKLYSNFLEFDGQNLKSDFLLTQKQIQSILVFLKDDEFTALKSNEALRSLSINFEKLWSIKKYETMMQQINSNKLVETPYMIEIIVQVLPQIMTKAQDIIKMKQNFINNFSKMFKAFLKSNYLIEMYKQQQKKHLIQLGNQFEEEKLEVTESDVQNLEQIDYHQVALKYWNQIEENSIPQQLQISQEFNGLENILINTLQPILQLPSNLNYKIQDQSIISLVCDALKEQNLTSFDFYSEFINYYQMRQIEKQKNLGKSLNIDRFLIDLQTYSIKLAKLMSKNEITQVQYKYQGLLYKEEGEEEKWLDEFFNDDAKNGPYKKDIRSCSLVLKKGSSFSFAHKSIQEFLIAADLYEMLILALALDVQILRSIIKNISREQIHNQDCLKFLQKLDQSQLDNQVNNLSLFERQKKQIEIQNKINLIINLVEYIKKHDFNLINYSTEYYTETRKYLIQKVSQENKIIELLKFLVQITKIDTFFVQSGSNSLNLLVEMKIDLTQQNFSNINIQNTSILGGNFAKCNLSGSKFENVNINATNLNGALLFNCEWKNLRTSELFQLDGHKNKVLSVCFSPDGTTLASGSQDNSIRLWNVKTGQQISQLDGHSDWVWSVCFSIDGTTLASGGRDSSIRLWNVQTGQQISQLDGHKNPVMSVCFSRDGTTLASGSYDNSIRLWDVKTRQQKSQLDGHSGIVYSVSFSPDRTTLASGSYDNTIRLWDVQTGKQKSQLDGHESAVMSVCFSPDGTSLASGSYDNSIRLWDVQTGKQKSQLDGHISPVLTVCFSPDGTTIASGSDDKGSNDKSIRLWDAKTGQQKSQLDGHKNSILSLCYSPDGTTIASGSEDQSIRLWDVKAGQYKSLSDGHSDGVISIDFSRDGTTLVSGSYDNSICLWDVKTGQQISQLDGHSKSVWSVSISPDGSTLASGSFDKSIRLWDFKTGQSKSQLNGHSNCVRSVCFSPEGTTLASGSMDKSVRLWDAKTGLLKFQLDGHSEGVLKVCFSPDGTTLASGSYDKSIRLWDVEQGQQKSQLDGHKGDVISVCYSPDGTKLASGSEDKSIRLWDVKTGLQKSQFNGHSQWVMSVCFSPDGTTLASSSSDKSIRLWDVESGEQKSQLDGHNHSVRSVCFSPDGTTLASCSNDKSIRVWDVETGQIKPQLNFEIRCITSVSFSPDGTILASSDNMSIRLWDIKTGQQKSQLDGHTDWVESVGFSPDGNTLASCSQDKSIRLWDVKTGLQKSKLEGNSERNFRVCFSPDGTTLASVRYDNSIRLWDVETGQQKSQLDGHDQMVTSVCFSPDGTILASGSEDKSIRLWDVENGLLKYQLDGHIEGVISVCFSPDGTVLASGSQDKSIRLWDVKTEQQKSQLDGHRGEVLSVCFSPDGTTLASGSYDNSIRLWDVETGQQKSQLDGHNDLVIQVCYSPNGTTLASGSYDGTIRLWDLKTGQQKAQSELYNYWAKSVCFSPDRSIFASSIGDNSICLWDVQTGQQQAYLDGHSDTVISVCFSPDGTKLASSSDDKSIRLWDVKAGQQQYYLDGHCKSVISLCFSPDGNILASACRDKSIYLWNVKTGQMIESQSKIYTYTLASIKNPLNLNHRLAKVLSNITILNISQQPIFQAQGALMLHGQIQNQSGIDLITLFKQKRSYFLEHELEQQFIEI